MGVSYSKTFITVFTVVVLNAKLKGSLMHGKNGALEKSRAIWRHCVWKKQTNLANN